MIYYFGRKLLGRRFRLYKLFVQLIPVPRRRLREWFQEKRIFFVVGSGRSGTKWLAATLNQCDGAIVEHEPILREGYACRDAVDHGSAEDYISKFRLKEIYLRLRNRESFTTYGEANSYLRRHVLPIMKHVSNVTVIHLVRDPRNVVRSHMSRETILDNHPVYDGFRPPAVDEYSSCWNDLTEFEKICWLWQWDNRYMRNSTVLGARLEDLVSSYDLFKKQVLDPVGLELEKDIWKSAVHKPKNVSAKFKMGPWDDWTEKQRDQFMSMCGKEMEKYGYES